MATREQRQNKQFVEKLLLIQGIKYDDWVDLIHTEYLQNNNKLILEALDSKLNKKKQKDEKDKEEEQEKEQEKESKQSFTHDNVNHSNKN